VTWNTYWNCQILHYMPIGTENTNIQFQQVRGSPLIWHGKWTFCVSPKSCPLVTIYRPKRYVFTAFDRPVIWDLLEHAGDLEQITIQCLVHDFLSVSSSSPTWITVLQYVQRMMKFVGRCIYAEMESFQAINDWIREEMRRLSIQPLWENIT